jgi:hypothetical protein
MPIPFLSGRMCACIGFSKADIQSHCNIGQIGLRPAVLCGPVEGQLWAVHVDRHEGRIADLRCECEIWSVHAKSRHAAAPLDATYEWTSILITEEYL